jgi:hypothetical protein
MELHELKRIHQLIDCSKVTKTVTHLKKLAPYYDNVLDAIYKDINTRLGRLQGLYYQFPAKVVKAEINKIHDWLQENPR